MQYICQYCGKECKNKMSLSKHEQYCLKNPNHLSRELLSNNGIVIVSATIDKKSKQIIAGPEILTRGFIYVKDSVQLIDDMKNICSSIILDNTHNGYVDYTKIKNTIRDELSKYLINQTGNKPMIITVIQEI